MKGGLTKVISISLTKVLPLEGRLSWTISISLARIPNTPGKWAHLGYYSLFG